MKNSEKAALFSALIFPGAGHILLKRYLRGMVFFLPALIASAFILVKVVQRTNFVIEKILSGAVSPDLATIMRLVSDSGGDSWNGSIATAVLIACWAISIFDSYQIGKREDVTRE